MRSRVMWAIVALLRSPSAIADPGGVVLCPNGDAGLAAVASALSEHRIAASDGEAVSYALRAAGEPHVWPRAITLEARVLDPTAATKRIEAWLLALPRRGRLRCATASTFDGGTQT